MNQGFSLRPAVFGIASNNVASATQAATPGDRNVAE
jgi:hypothetical protein